MFANLTTILNLSKLIVRKMYSENYKGVPLGQIYRGFNKWDFDHLPPIENKRCHTVLYRLPVPKGLKHPPDPFESGSKWDQHHVRLPNSQYSEYKTECASDASKTVTASRWEIIERALLRDIKNSRELEQAILSYNGKYVKEWNFKSLHALFEKELDEEEGEAFFGGTMPRIIELALQLPQILPSAIPLLKQGQNKSISLSQKQVACLLANAFLCTFPRRNDYRDTSEYASYPTINFNTLFQTTGDQNIEKIKCICQYFQRVCRNMPVGVITFMRRSVQKTQLPNWSACNDEISKIKLHVCDEGTIEDDGAGLLQVDFANKFLGGGVLNYGCVQEEIRFVICPELLVSRLFTEKLEDNECMIIMGCERFSAYTGYASTFQFLRPYVDDTPFDSSKRRKCTIVAIDAEPFRSKSQQFEEDMLLRELNKAYIGFKHELETPAPGVATGNWGCGAFGGNKHLKSLLQLMACCYTERPLVYYTFGDEEFRDDLFMIYEYMVENQFTIRQLYTCLKRYAANGAKGHLYKFIMSYHQNWCERNQKRSNNNGQSSKPANRLEDKSGKQKRSSSERSSSKRETDHETERFQILSNSDYKKYFFDDSDEELASIDEIMDQIEKTHAENYPNSVNKKPKKSTIVSNTTPTTPSERQTIATCFQTPINSTTENQEKRPRSELIEMLDDDYQQKSPAKIKRSFTNKSNPVRDIQLDTPIASSTIIDQDDQFNQTIDVANSAAASRHHDEKDEPVNEKNMSVDLFSDGDDDIFNKITDDCFDEHQDQNNDNQTAGDDSDASSTDIFHDAQSTVQTEKSSYLKQALENCQTLINNDTEHAGNDSNTPPKDIFHDAEGSMRAEKPSHLKLAPEQRQPLINEYFKKYTNKLDKPLSSVSTSDISSIDDTLNEMEDRSNSDLNSESSQLKALHMESDK